MRDSHFNTLKGETLIAVTGLRKGSDDITLLTSSGRTFRMYHSQDCCETVQVEDVTGNVEDILNSPLLLADVSTNSEDPKPSEYPESFTWTFYRLGTVKGYVDVRWLGESNGYYSESVDFVELR